MKREDEAATMTLTFTRRTMLERLLMGAGAAGLKALATGLPASLFLASRRTLAAALPACTSPGKAQFFIVSSSGFGDPLNANVPGCYADTKIVHSPDPDMAATTFKLGSQNVTAARPWSTLPQWALDRTAFWHVMTNTPAHPAEQEVLRLMGTTRPAEMLPSLLSKHLATCLTTIQPQPITVGAANPNEGLTYAGAALPVIPPLSLKATLGSPNGALGQLQGLRDQALTDLAAILKSSDATSSQKRFIDDLVLSQNELRNLNESLLSSLASIDNNGLDAQMTAAVALITMKVSPVIVIHMPFGGDNHRDVGLDAETTQTIASVTSLGTMMSNLPTELRDSVSFLSLNVFGRTLGPGNEDGRQHNANHQVSIAIGKAFKPGVIGGVGPVSGDYGAMAIDSTTGAGSASGDVKAVDTLASFGKTMLASIGVESAAVETAIPAGRVIKAALL
jgi:hypothetical protein